MDQGPLEPGQFTGLIVVEPQKTDWIRGVETGIIETPILPSGDWTPYLPEPQMQKIFWTSANGIPCSFETDACVSFSAEQDLATYGNLLLDISKIPADTLAFLNNNKYIVNGKLSFSPRFVAKVSNTTPNGNSLPAVLQAITEYGLIPDSLWPMPTAEIEALDTTQEGWQDKAWAIYYASVPQNLLDLGKEFLTHFQPQYEWISYPANPQTLSQFVQDLMVAPLQIATAVCGDWNVATPIEGCGAGAQHATELYNIEANGDDDIFDHYAPFNKILAADYNITYAMRATLVPLATTTPSYPPPIPFKFSFTNQMDFGVTSAEVTALQNALKTDGEFPLNVQSTGYFGTITQTSVEEFQVKYGIVQAGGAGYGRVGPLTLAQLNKLFA